MTSHPAVKDAVVQGYKISGVGELPRAYLVLKGGFEASADEILSFAHSRLADTDRLRGGVVFVDKLAKDSTGKVLVNLAKYDHTAVLIDKDFIASQPKVKVN